MQPRRVRWNRVIIVFAGAFAVLAVCCIGVWALAPHLRRIIQAPFWKTDPQLAAQAAHRFIDYDLPLNYQELKVLHIQDSDAAVVITHRERPGDLIFLGSVLEGVIGVEDWRTRSERDLSSEMADHRYNTHVVATDQRTIRGQPTTLLFFEGSDESGRNVRQVVCAFKGKAGDMLLAIVAGQDTWDQPTVDQFLQSIR